MRYVVLSVLLGMVFVSACAPASAPTPTLAPPTPTVASTPTRPASTAVMVQPPPVATVATNLRTDIIEFVSPLMSDDQVVVLDDVQQLNGVKSAQSSGTAIQVTYDPTKVTLQQIIMALVNYGVIVKK